MKKDITMTIETIETNGSVEQLFKSMIKKIRKPIIFLCNFYSRTLEEKINERQTILLLNAQVAFIFAIFPMDISLIFRLIFALWFAVAVIQCKHSGLKTSDEPD